MNICCLLICYDSSNDPGSAHPGEHSVEASGPAVIPVDVLNACSRLLADHLSNTMMAADGLSSAVAEEVRKDEKLMRRLEKTIERLLLIAFKG